MCRYDVNHSTHGWLFFWGGEEDISGGKRNIPFPQIPHPNPPCSETWAKRGLGWLKKWPFPRKKRLFSKRLLLSEEMLNMLDSSFLRSPSRSPHKHSTYLTYSTFQQKQAHFHSRWGLKIQHTQHFQLRELCWIPLVMNSQVSGTRRESSNI